MPRQEGVPQSRDYNWMVDYLKSPDGLGRLFRIPGVIRVDQELLKENRIVAEGGVITAEKDEDSGKITEVIIDEVPS